MKIVVVGGGKMGLPLACMFAHNGASVTVCDRSASIVNRINRGEDPHKEPEQAPYFENATRAGTLRASTDTTSAVAEANAVVVIVPALLRSDHTIDWTNLIDASNAIARGLQQGTLVSFETTLPLGGCRNHLIPVLESGGLRAGVDFAVVFSPERIKSRLIFARFANTPKIIGGINAESAAAGDAFYQKWLGTRTINVGSLEAAELVKLAGMIYRDVNIALANELAGIAERAGLNIWPVIEAANTDSETAMLQPGIGVGGHCTPVYPYFMINADAESRRMLRLTGLGRQINETQPAKQVGRLAIALGGLSGTRVHILGLGFRPQIREDSYSPAYAIRDALVAQGALPTVEDRLYSDEEISARGLVPARLGTGQFEAVVLNTAHPEFADPDFAKWARTGVRAVLDGRAFWSRNDVEAAGLLYIGVGSPLSSTKLATTRSLAEDRDPKCVLDPESIRG